MNTNALRYYAEHDELTDPGQYARLLSTFPSDLPALHAAINGVLIHIWKIRAHHPHLLAGHEYDVFTRHIKHTLASMAAMNERSLSVERPVEGRVIGDCRHFATLLCTVFRERGIPARTRCGFATYLEDTHLQDHWICEYWDAQQGRWIMEDADLQRHDVPADEFITGAEAWRMCRADGTQWDRFGFDSSTRGKLVVVTNLVRDFAALNGFASVSGDCWGIAWRDPMELNEAETALLDRVVKLSTSDDTWTERRALYESSEELRVPDVINCYDYIVTDTWRQVDWRKEP